MSEYNEQLKFLQQQASRREHLEATLQTLREQRYELDRKAVRLKIAMQDEQSDVDRLEKKTLASFWYGLLGKKEALLDEERREAYAAAVKYEAAVRELEALDADISRCVQELAEISGCGEQYAQVLAEKTQALKNSGSAAASEVLQLEQQLSRLESREKELNEAISAGNSARMAAKAVLQNLSDAEHYGTWDLVGGGLFADIAKYGSLEDAQQQAEYLQKQLRRFRSELADVTIEENIQVQIDGMLQFADYFFDGLLADWSVLKRIQSSAERVRRVDYQIQSVLNRLEKLLSGVKSERVRTQEKLDSLIINAPV